MRQVYDVVAYKQLYDVLLYSTHDRDNATSYAGSYARKHDLQMRGTTPAGVVVMYDNKRIGDELMAVGVVIRELTK